MLDSEEPRHSIIIGARGMGKSSLLRRIAIAVNRDEALSSAFMPLPFREEQYNVISLDAFWRNCGEALAEWCEQVGRDEVADAMDRAVASPDWRDADKAEAAFLAQCEALGRRPLLLLDNLDIILDGLKEADNWKLRRALQARNGPVVIGGATKLLSQGADRQAPFYEFFYPSILEPLEEAELLQCMHSLANRRGAAGARVKALLAREPERIRTLYALTGGNPRVLTLIYQVLERAETDTILDDLEALLDQVTPFYKARIEEYNTPQQRAVIDAIALNWDPIGSRGLANTTGLEVTTISSQLSRLRKDGLVEEVPSSGARSSYQLAERFLNIWYLMRHGTRRTRHRLRWLSLFLARLFNAEEINGMARQARSRDQACAWSSDYREAVLAAQEMIGLQSDSAPLAMSGDVSIESNKAEADAPWRDHEKRFNAFYEEGSYEEALDCLEAVVIAAESVEAIQSRAALGRALVNKGVVLGRLGRDEDALAAYEAVLSRFGDAEELALRERVAWALFNKGVVLGRLGRDEDALAAYEAVLSRFGDAEELALREQVGRALFNKGVVLGRLGRDEDALAAYEAVQSRSGDAEELALREQVAWALFNKGVVLGRLGRDEDALAAYEAVLSRFGDADELAVREQVARALANKGFVLGRLGRDEDALAAYEAVQSRFGDAEEPALWEQVAWALVNKGFMLGRLGRDEDELAAYEVVLSRFGDAEELALREQVAWALVNKGVVLGRLGRDGDAIAAYEAVLSRFGDAEELALREQVAEALGGTGNVLLDHRGELSQAEQVYRDGLDLAPDDLVLKANLAWALVLQGKNAELPALRSSLAGLEPVGLFLLDAAGHLMRANFGLAADSLGQALALDLAPGSVNFFDDLLRLIRFAVQSGYGERLIDWFEETGNHDKYAPFYVALIAFERGERFLNESNPEVRVTARRFFDILRWPDHEAPT